MKTDCKRCLLIDDRIVEHKIFANALELTGVSVDCSYDTSARKALAKLIATPTKDLPQVIFLDVYMPDMDGKAFLQAIKKVERLKNIPIYAYTSSEDSADVSELIKSGAAYYIMKTSNIPALTKALQVLLGSLVR